MRPRARLAVDSSVSITSRRVCGRNSLFAPQADPEEPFDATARDPVRPRYDIAPGEDRAIVRNDEPDVVEPVDVGERTGLDQFGG